MGFMMLNSSSPNMKLIVDYGKIYAILFIVRIIVIDQIFTINGSFHSIDVL